MTTTPGIDLSELDDTVSPQQDLFRHVNGRWLAAVEIPDDKTGYGTFSALRDASEEACRLIIEEAQLAPQGTEARKIGDLYASFMNEDNIAAVGLGALHEQLQRIDAVTSTSAFAALLGTLQREGVPSFITPFIMVDMGNPERYVMYLEQSGLSLPDEAFYHQENFTEILLQLPHHIARSLSIVGLADAEERAARIVAIEHRIAAVQWDAVTARDTQKSYNLMSWDDVAARVGAFDLEAWREGIGFSSTDVAEVVVRQPSFLEATTALVTDEFLTSWCDWLRWRMISDYAPYLTRELDEENFRFYGSVLSGVPVQRERWKRAVGLVEGVLGEAVGKIYVDRHFPASVKEQMDDLVTHLLDAYRDSITHLTWMGEETKGRALEKLSKFRSKIGYPVNWRDYSALSVTPDNLLANLRAVNAFSFDYELAKLGQPIDRDRWWMTPQTVNAGYSPLTNDITFPAAILQPPFFDPDRDAAANYGAIGAVIGHEIGHGFDDQGSRYDGDGRLADWWQDADRAAFDQRAQMLIEQFNALSPADLPGLYVNGALTIGENIGDLGGLTIAWKAYVASLGETSPPVIDGLTAAQRFFYSFATAWRTKMRPAEAENRLVTDVHSPPEFRCNQISRNLDVFHEAFAVTPADAMWLDPADRVTIW